MRLTSKDGEIVRQWKEERDRLIGSVVFVGHHHWPAYKGADVFVAADMVEGNRMLRMGIPVESTASTLAARLVAREHGATAVQRALVRMAAISQSNDDVDHLNSRPKP